MRIYQVKKDKTFMKTRVEVNWGVHAMKSGVNKPVVFYGISITHGGCASRPRSCVSVHCRT